MSCSKQMPRNISLLKLLVMSALPYRLRSSGALWKKKSVFKDLTGEEKGKSSKEVMGQLWQ